MAIVQTSPDHGRLARRFTHVSWPLLRWSAAAGGIGGLAGWAIGEPFVGPNLEPMLALYLHNLLYSRHPWRGYRRVVGRPPRHSEPFTTPGAPWSEARAAPRRPWRRDWLHTCAVHVQHARRGVDGARRGWAILGAFVGLCPGLATRDRRRARRGVLGGLMGGFAGGLLFNLVATLIRPARPIVERPAASSPTSWSASASASSWPWWRVSPRRPG